MTYAPSPFVVVVRVMLPVSWADNRVAPNKHRTARASIPARNDLPYTDVRNEKWRDRFPFTLKPPVFSLRHYVREKDSRLASFDSRGTGKLFQCASPTTRRELAPKCFI